MSLGRPIAKSRWKHPIEFERLLRITYARQTMVSFEWFGGKAIFFENSDKSSRGTELTGSLGM
jgi:hypothetical protein